MLAEEKRDFTEEIAVQDRVACEYEQKRYQDPYARRYHDWWTDQMLARVRSDGRFLDNGCGTGLLFNKLPPGQVVGLDISREMLRYASRHSRQLILGNSQELPLKDSCFDVVFCRSLLHHLPQPELAVKEKLRPEEKTELKILNEELASMGFLSTFRDPLYSRFLKALSEYEEFEKPALTPKERAMQAKLAREIIKKLKEEQA